MVDGRVTRAVRRSWTSANVTSGHVSGRRARGAKGARSQEVRTFASMTNALLQVRGWLTSERVSVVTMEATGDYWEPVYCLLEDAGLELVLVNARDAKGPPGRKRDVGDSGWLCRLTERGLLRASLVPPEPIRRLRDLTRYRATTTRERRSGSTTAVRRSWKTRA